MLQESTSASWDLRHMTLEPFAPLKIYLLLLLVVCIIAAIRLISLWRMAPPFRAHRQHDNPTYLPLLQSSAASLKRWSRFIGFGWGLFASTSVYDFCGRVLDEKSVSRFVTVFYVREVSTTLTMALVVALLAFLIQWHIGRRIENLARA